jgi:hypothetical protein
MDNISSFFDWVWGIWRDIPRSLKNQADVLLYGLVGKKPLNRAGIFTENDFVINMDYLKKENLFFFTKKVLLIMEFANKKDRGNREAFLAKISINTEANPKSDDWKESLDGIEV